MHRNHLLVPAAAWLSSDAESTSMSQVALFLSELAGKDIGVSSGDSRPRTMAWAFPRGAFALLPENGRGRVATVMDPGAERGRHGCDG